MKNNNFNCLSLSFKFTIYWNSFIFVKYYKLSNCIKSPLPPFYERGSRSNVNCFLYNVFKNNLTERDKQFYLYVIWDNHFVAGYVVAFVSVDFIHGYSD